MRHSMRKWMATAMVAGLGGTAQADLHWNFGTDAENAAPTSGLPSDITGGSFAVFTAGGFNTTSASSGYGGASGDFNAYMTVTATGAIDPATATRYYQFALTPEVSGRVHASGFQFASRSTASGPTSIALYSSADSYATALAFWTVAADSTWALTGLESFSVLGAVNETVTFRLYPGQATGGTSNWRIDDVSLAIPEPATLSLLGMMGAALWIRRRRQP